MSGERWFRNGDEAAAFDWQRPAHELDIPPEIARALYLRAMRRAGDVGIARAEQLYLRWLREAAQQQSSAAAATRPPGRTTRVVHESNAVAKPAQQQPNVQRAPGKWTRAQLEAVHQEDAELPERGDVQLAVRSLSSPSTMEAAETVAAATSTSTSTSSVAQALREQLLAAAASGRGAVRALASADPATSLSMLRALRGANLPGQTTPVLRLVARADDGEAGRMLARGSDGRPLPADLAARLGPHVGPEAAGAAQLHTDETADLVAAAHHARAVALGDEIYFARGEYEPGTERGTELIAHELTHVAQARRGELTRAAAKGVESGGTLDRAEAEADLRARLAVVEVRPPAMAVPSLAQPSAQPTSPGERASKIAAQQQRLTLAGQPSQPDATKQPAPLRPAPPVPQTAPTMAPAPKPASTGNAYIDAFQAPPSKQATELWAKAGGDATTQVAADQAKFDAGLAPLPVVLDGGEAKHAKGGVGGAKSVKQPPPAGAAPPATQPTPTPVPPPVTAARATAQNVQPNADKAQMKAEGQKVLDALPAKVPDAKTDPGPAPVTDLAGQADPTRTLGEHQHAIDEGAKALDDAKAKIISGPGAAQVQPVKLNEKVTVPKEQAAGTMPALPPVEGMAKFKKWNLPSNAQASFDEIAKPKMDAHLADAKSKVSQAESKRDADRTKAVDDTQEKVKKAHADADKQQQTKVAETRSQISNHQADTLLKQEKEVQKLDQQSGEKKKGTISKINERVAKDQAKVDADYKGAQKQAEDKKKQGDEEAKRKKEEAERKAEEDKSWWEKAADVVCDAIKAVAEEIDKALDAICKAITDLIDTIKDAACQLIDAARDFVCAALTEFGDWLKSAVTALIGSVFPELAEALNRLIDQAVNAAKAAVNAIADGLKAAVTALCDSLKAAVQAAIAAFKAAVQAAATLAQALITGDWALVAKMVLEGILRALGIDPAAFWALIGKAMDSIDKIIENPGAFVGHLIDAVKLGFQQFGQNFWTHLKNGVVQWLFGTFAQAGITMPASFDVAGIFDLVCQVLGLTWPRMRGKVVKVIGEKNTERLEFVAKYLEALVTGGFAGLWEKVQQDMSGLWDMVIGGVRDWLMEKLVQQAIIKIATMWNPAGAIIQLIQTAWNVYCWVRENAQRIFGLVQAVVDSIANIVAGNIGGAANYIEASLAKLVPIAISLFANLLGLGGIADKIRSIIEKIQSKVDQAIDKLIARVKGMFKGKGGDKKDSEEGELDVPKSLDEPKQAPLENVGSSLTAQLQQARNGEVIYQKADGDPQRVTKDLLAQHHDASMDRATGKLTLPPIDTAALSRATSLEQMGQLAAQQTGVSKVTLDKTKGGVALRGHINPETPLTKPFPLMSDDELRAHLGPLAQAMWQQMQAAYPRRVRAPDGVMLSTADNTRGPCLSLVMEITTGKVYYRQNTGEPAIPKGGGRTLQSPLHERTQDRLDELGQSPEGYRGEGWTRDMGYPGSHSEVQGTNEVLTAMPGTPMENVVIYNVRTEDINLSPAPIMKRCANCVVITDGARVLTD